MAKKGSVGAKTKAKFVKKITPVVTRGSKAEIKTASPAIPRPMPRHMDYRALVDSEWRKAMYAPGLSEQGQNRLYAHRQAFEDLFREESVCALIRTLGLWETTYHNQYASLIGADPAEGQMWLTVWVQTRQLLTFRTHPDLDCGLLDRTMLALGRNAGFSDVELGA